MRVRLQIAACAVFAAVPVWGQYSGPAMLSRGEAPAAMARPQISFRPFVELAASYDTGLAAASVNSTGDLANASSSGLAAIWGVSGAHSWKHTTIGVDYRGNLNHFFRKTAFDQLNQSLLLGLTHDFSRRVRLSVRQSAGTFARDIGLVGMAQTVPFDPLTSFIPTTDYFDNRTYYLSTQADLIIQKSARLSYAIGGAGFLTHRRSSALNGVNGALARGDVQYRLSRQTTIGALYDYTHFSFTRVESGADIHRVAFSFGVRFTRWWELSGYAGAARMESKFVQQFNVDPIIRALLGISQTTQVIHTIQWVPNYGVRLSRTFAHGVAHLSAAHAITPGNGLFLTSTMSTYMAGYDYTGLRRWSFSANTAVNQGSSRSNIRGKYNNYTGTLSASRQIVHAVHFVLSYSARQYDSPDFSRYHRLVHEGRIGIGFTPGDVPLRVW